MGTPVMTEKPTQLSTCMWVGKCVDMMISMAGWREHVRSRWATKCVASSQTPNPTPQPTPYLKEVIWAGDELEEKARGDGPELGPVRGAEPREHDVAGEVAELAEEEDREAGLDLLFLEGGKGVFGSRG